MHNVEVLSADRDMRRKILHIDSLSPTAKRDHCNNANDYREVRRYLAVKPMSDVLGDERRAWRGSKDYLSGYKPTHEILMPDGKLVTVPEYLSYIRSGRADERGRTRKHHWYRGILNLARDEQVLLRHLCLSDPVLGIDVLKGITRFLRIELRRIFPTGPLQLAFHLTTRLCHWEWSAAKYDLASGKKAGHLVKWDMKRRSIEHVLSWERTAQPASGAPPKLNSRMEIELLTRLWLFYRVMVKAGRLPELTELKKRKGLEFFKGLQMASLRDRSHGRSPKARDARRLLEKLTLPVSKVIPDPDIVTSPIASIATKPTAAIAQDISTEVDALKRKRRKILFDVLSAQPGTHGVTKSELALAKTLLRFDAKGEFVGGITDAAREIYADDTELLAASEVHANHWTKVLERREKTTLATQVIKKLRPRRRRGDK